jgi:hypothetical protein
LELRKNSVQKPETAQPVSGYPFYSAIGSGLRKFRLGLEEKEILMFFVDLLVALCVGWVLVWLVSLAFSTKGPWDSFLWFFLVVALFTWVGGVWLVPFGPSWGGIGWFPFIFVGVLAVLMLTAASPRSYHRIVPGTKITPAPENRSVIAVDVFFWLFILCLLVFGSSHYYWYPR